MSIPKKTGEKIAAPSTVGDSVMRGRRRLDVSIILAVSGNFLKEKIEAN